MSKHSYFTFSLGDRLYGINIVHIGEIFPLPEIAPISGASQGLIGVIDLRGEHLPILDLSFSLGSHRSDYHLTDSVVIVKQAQIHVGIIVNQVHGIKDTASEALSTTPSQDQRSLNVEQPIIAGVLIDEETFILNDPQKWLSFSEIQQAITRDDWATNSADESDASDELQSVKPRSLAVQPSGFYSNATPQERAVLRERTNRLKQAPESKQAEELNPLAVITLGNFLFGFDLKIVKEFIDARQIVPIPCCPAHFAGNVNLRGEILTLVSLNELLNLPLKKLVIPIKVMIMEIDNTVAGIVIDSIQDAMFLLNPRELKKAANAIGPIPPDYLQGTVPYQERSLHVLDLPAIFSKGLIAQ